MSRKHFLLVVCAIIIGALTGFSLGIMCEGRAEAQTPAFDPRISGGSVLQQAAADWLFIIRPDFAAVVTEVRFVPQDQLVVNALGNTQFKWRCFTDDDGRPLAVGRCIGESEGRSGKVRMAREYMPPDIDLLLKAIAHEYAHILLFKNCGLCTLDIPGRTIQPADECAMSAANCRRSP